MDPKIPGRLLLPWRTGRHNAQIVYAQLGAEPSDDDPMVGVMMNAGLAAIAVSARNASLAGIGTGAAQPA